MIQHTGEGGPVRVRADDNDPAETVATILARRMYGKRGTVGAMRLDSWAKDGSSHTYVCDNCGQIALAANRGADCPCGGTYSMDHTDICKQ